MQHQSNLSCYQACCSKKQHQSRKVQHVKSDFGSVPKQLLQLRSDIPSLFEPIPTRRQDNFDSYRRSVRPMRSSTYKVAPSSSSAANYAKITPVMRTPSSGISSASSTENMMSGMSLDDIRKFHEDIDDPAVEIPQRVPHVGAEMKKRPKENSYSFVKQQPDFVDAMYSSASSVTTGIGSCSTAASEKSQKPSTIPRCQFCWDSYVMLAQSVAGNVPISRVNGPWDWHDLMDGHKNITCPRFWFFNMERAGHLMKDPEVSKPANTMEKPRGTVIY